MRNRTKATLWILLVLLVGTVFGGTLTFFWVQPRFATASGSPDQERQKDRKGPSSERILNHLSEVLSLDDSQKEQLRQILESSRERYHEASQTMKKQYRAIRLETREQIRTLLSPEQGEKFDQFLQEHDRKHHHKDQKDGDC